jgi:RNA polymerase sigma-70 factor, ECF subfamily
MMDTSAATLVLEGQMSDNTAQVYAQTRDPAALAMKNNMDRSDSQDALIRRAAAGDVAAVETIYQQFKQPVFNLAYRYSSDRATAEDLLQDIFIKIFTHLGDVKDTGTFAAWIYRIALNECYSFLREKKSRSQKTIPMAEIEGKLEEASYDGHEQNIRKPLEEAIQALPAKLRGVFVLHDVQGFKHREIARSLGCSVGTSKSQLFKARLRVRQYLKKKGIFLGDRS